MQNPRQYKIPDWFLNRQKDVKDGKYSQVRNCSRLEMSDFFPKLELNYLSLCCRHIDIG